MDHTASIISHFEEIIYKYDHIDWDKSADVIAQAKRDHFPEMLTMVEKLSNWQREQTSSGQFKA